MILQQIKVKILLLYYKFDGCFGVNLGDTYVCHLGLCHIDHDWMVLDSQIQCNLSPWPKKHTNRYQDHDTTANKSQNIAVFYIFVSRFWSHFRWRLCSSSWIVPYWPWLDGLWLSNTVLSDALTPKNTNRHHDHDITANKNQNIAVITTLTTVFGVILGDAHVRYLG